MNNPLQCVCGLLWLYKRLQPYNETVETHRYRNIQWRCADVPKKFNELNDTDFTGCDADSGIGSTTSECEDLIPTTTPAVIYPTDPRLELKVTERTQSSVTVQWVRSDEFDVVDQVITYQRLDNNLKVRLQLTARQLRHVLTDLSPNTTYKVCVELTTGNVSMDFELIVSCCPAMTSLPGGFWASSAYSELVLAALIGGGLAVVVILSVAVYCCCAARRRRQRPISTAPKATGQTKRFRKLGTVATSPSGVDRTSNPYNAEVDRAIAQSVERLDPESREVLANLLRSASAYSLDHIGGASNYRSPPTSGLYVPAGDQERPTSAGDVNYYETLPDDVIPTDPYV